MQLSPVIQAITGLFLIGFIVCFSYKIIRFDYTFGCELCNADDNGVKALKFTNIMKATNLILLTEDDYNQLAETIANRVIQQLQGKTHNVEQPKSDDGFVFQEEAAKLLKVSLRTLIRWDKSGYLPKRHVGRRVAYRREDINRLAGAGQCHD